MNKYMNTTTVRDALTEPADAGTASSKVIGNDKGRNMSKNMRNKGYVPIYSLSDKSWRYFHETAVFEIN